MEEHNHVALMESLIPPFTYDLGDWFTHIKVIWMGAELTDLQKFTFIVRAILIDEVALITEVLQNPPEVVQLYRIKLLQVGEPGSPKGL